ncbi:SGNH/GDSL hydrolase family protein [Chitinophaga sedimenti]|uniref:SGNH/GDSL hydrolase family protein n=1 Tax=Chitinophaga sedimenti TaxID=2033606 RepID=UPI0020061F32|nr:SGNH/GDSL hydrolase family protein [Chitinophaga sedimenti]MCK7556261.1 SGNH/GDSL hydrolase family protein [Chitinophaga sedimenti]
MLNAGVFDNGDNTFMLRWATNHTSLYNYPNMAGIGSSTLEGVGTSAPNRLTDRIAAWLTSSTISPTWSNFAVGGYTTQNVLPTDMGGTPGHNITTALNLNPDFIYCVLPTNDAGTGIPVATSMANLRYIDNLAKAKGIPIIFHTTQPRNGVSDFQYQMLRSLGDSIRFTWPTRFVEGYSTLADPDSVRRLNPIYDSGDGLHCNPAGTQALARVLFKTLESYFVPITGVRKYYVDTSADGNSWSQYDVIPSGNTVKKTYSRPRTGLIYFRVRAEFADSGTLVSNVTSLVPPGAIGGFDHRLLVDLGGDNQNTLNPANGAVIGWPTASPDAYNHYWNNWSGSGGSLGFRNGAIIRSLITTENITSPVSIELMGNPAVTYDANAATQSMNFGGISTADVGDYPTTATRESMYIHEGAPDNSVALKIRGLSPTNQYRIKLWGARLYNDAGTRMMQSRLQTETWAQAKVMETKYATGQPGDYNNAIIHNVTGMDSVIVYMKTKNSTFTYLSVIDIGITGTLPPTPIVNVPDVVVNLPKDSASLLPVIETNGINITSRTWEQVSGPSTAIIRSPFSTNTIVAGLTNGTYIFRIKLTTATATISDEVKVSVFPPSGKPSMRVQFSKTQATAVPGWVNMYGDPSVAVISVQDPVKPWIVNSVATSSWVPYVGANGSDVDGMTTNNNSGVIPDIVLKGYWYNSGSLNPNHNLKVSGLLVNKTYKVTLVASRSSSNSATSPRTGYYTVGDSTRNHSAWLNTSESSVITGCKPNANGQLFIDVYIPLGVGNLGSMSYINGLIIEEE